LKEHTKTKAREPLPKPVPILRAKRWKEGLREEWGGTRGDKRRPKGKKKGKKNKKKEEGGQLSLP